MFEAKKDCFAYDSTGRKAKCSALRQLYCKHNGKCHFYKTRRQLDEELQRLHGNGRSEINGRAVQACNGERADKDTKGADME